MRIDADGVYYKELNKTVRDAVAAGEKQFELVNVNGQRYIGVALPGRDVRIDVLGVPGNDLATFMNGPTVTVHANAQDAVANTMNDGKVIVHGDAGDVCGYSMRGGKLHIRGEVGYRVGIHIKSYQSQIPVIVVGRTARDFFGEYMAGGVLVLLGLERRSGTPLVGDYMGTGMHAGKIYVRGDVDPDLLGKEVGAAEPNEEDLKELRRYVSDYCADFDLSVEEVMAEPFTKFYPKSLRPYGSLYTY